jgi:hypothetical protein
VLGKPSNGVGNAVTLPYLYPSMVAPMVIEGWTNLPSIGGVRRPTLVPGGAALFDCVTLHRRSRLQIFSYLFRGTARRCRRPKHPPDLRDARRNQRRRHDRIAWERIWVDVQLRTFPRRAKFADLLVYSLAPLLDVPLVIADATCLLQAGHVNKDVAIVHLKLYLKSGQGEGCCQHQAAMSVLNAMYRKKDCGRPC